MWMYTLVVSSVLFNHINLSVYLLLSGCIRSQLWHPDLHCAMWEISFWSMDSAAAGCRLQRGRASAVAACRLSGGGIQPPAHVGSVAAAPRLSCSAACGILVPQPGIEPTSPALQDRFFTTGPQEKSHLFYFKISLSCCSISWKKFTIFQLSD